MTTEQLYIHILNGASYQRWDEAADLLNQAYNLGLNDTTSLCEHLKEDAQQDGFIGIVVENGTEGELLGIITGYATNPHQFWYRDYADHLDPDYLIDGFAIAELGLLDSHRKRGIAHRLLDFVLDYATGSGYQRALAAIDDDNTVCRKLAERHGLAPLTESIHILDQTTPTRIYKRDLGR